MFCPIVGVTPDNRSCRKIISQSSCPLIPPNDLPKISTNWWASVIIIYPNHPVTTNALALLFELNRFNPSWLNYVTYSWKMPPLPGPLTKVLRKHLKLQELRKTVPLCHVAWPKFDSLPGTIQQQKQIRSLCGRSIALSMLLLSLSSQDLRLRAVIRILQAVIQHQTLLRSLRILNLRLTTGQEIKTKATLERWPLGANSKIKYMPLTKSYPSIQTKYKVHPQQDS